MILSISIPSTSATNPQTTSTTAPVTVPAVNPLNAAEIRRIFASTLSWLTWNNRAVAPFPPPLISPSVTNAAVDNPAVATSRDPFPANILEISPEILPNLSMIQDVTFVKTFLIGPSTVFELTDAFFAHFVAIFSKNPEMILHTLLAPALFAFSATFSTDSVVTFPFTALEADSTTSSFPAPIMRFFTLFASPRIPFVVFAASSA